MLTREFLEDAVDRARAAAAAHADIELVRVLGLGDRGCVDVGHFALGKLSRAANIEKEKKEGNRSGGLRCAVCAAADDVEGWDECACDCFAIANRVCDCGVVRGASFHRRSGKWVPFLSQEHLTTYGCADNCAGVQGKAASIAINNPPLRSQVLIYGEVRLSWRKHPT